MATNPYAAIAIKEEENPYAKIAIKDDQSPPPESFAHQAGEFGKDVAKGLGESAVGLMSSADEFARKHLPAFMTNQNFGFGKPADLENVKQMATPVGTTQAVLKGIGDVAQFFIPGGAEEKAIQYAGAIPKVGKAAMTAAKVLAPAISAGSVNAAQGGNFGTGAAMGAAGPIIGQGLKAMAPSLAEGALNIRKLDRAYGKGGGNIGRAILNETRGIRPSSVAESAEQRLGELNPQLNVLADKASIRPNQARALLQAPMQEIPLSEPFIRDVKGELIPAAPFPRGNIVGGNSARVASELGSTESTIPPRLTRDDLYMTSGVREPQPLPTSGPGVLLRRPPASGGSIPAQIANPIASLGSARGALSQAFGTAARQGERTTANQLQPMATHLGETMSGEQIPENITPRQLLDLKRGFGNEFIHRWNPETMTGVKGTAARTYHEMAQEFNRVVPGAEGLNTRISNLIPVAKRAASEELNAPTIQKIAHRVAAHTGALTGAGIGGTLGYREGGIPGAVLGGVAGIATPELIASPTGQMAAARLLNKTSSLRPLVGTAAQFTSRKDKK